MGFSSKGIGQRVEDTKVKAEALHRYLININQNRGYSPKVIGGIVVRSRTQFYYYDQIEYHDYGESRENWINFNEILRNVATNVYSAEYLKKLAEKTGSD